MKILAITLGAIAEGLTEHDERNTMRCPWCLGSGKEWNSKAKRPETRPKCLGHRRVGTERLLDEGSGR